MLAPGALIELWERGAARGPLERGLLLLGAAAPEIAADALADVDLRTRDAHVFALRAVLFGMRFTGVADCPRCAVRLEFSCDGAALRPAQITSTRNADIAVRLPNSRDLALALDAGAGEDDCARRLVERCCTLTDGDWDDARYGAAEAALDAEVGAAHTQLTLCCADCGSTWQSPFDICGWLWSELERHVCGLLDDVHRLASRYGWDEARILALHPARRAAYLARCDT